MNKNREFFNEKAPMWDQREMKSSDFFDVFVKDKFFLKPGMKVLDLACGTGIITNSIFKVTNSETIGMDISDKMIEIAISKNENPNVSFINEDFYEFSNEKFDAIVCHNAYPHFLDKIAFKNKAYELLNDNGILVIAHSFSREIVNKKHERPNMIESNVTLPAEEEVKNYVDLFNVLTLEDDEFYILVLKKK